MPQDQRRITPDDLVKVLDFGLARAISAESGDAGLGVSEDGTVVGTLGYMSPEQVRGEALDHRTDLWATGAMASGPSRYRPAAKRLESRKAGTTAATRHRMAGTCVHALVLSRVTRSRPVASRVAMPARAER